MKRVPDPEIRKRQILETAMRLFYEKGYENTSLEDVANELGVVKSLCYRYYASKEALFRAALDEYAEECCGGLTAVLHDTEMTLPDRLREVLRRLLVPEETGRYHAFFHRMGNESMHEQLSAKMCRALLPHLTEELKQAQPAGEHPEILAQVLLYGLFGVWQENGAPAEDCIRQYGELADTLLDAAESGRGAT